MAATCRRVATRARLGARFRRIVAGDAADAPSANRAKADAVVPVGALFDKASGLAQLNRITSAAARCRRRDVRRSRATRRSLLDAAQKSDDTKVLLFVSANEAGWLNPVPPADSSRESPSGSPATSLQSATSSRRWQQDPSARSSRARVLLYSPTKFDVLRFRSGIPQCRQCRRRRRSRQDAGHRRGASAVGRCAGQRGVEAVSDGTAAPKLKAWTWWARRRARPGAARRTGAARRAARSGPSTR